MKKLSQMIDELITPAAVEHKLKYHDDRNYKERHYYWKNVEKLLAGEIESRKKRPSSQFLGAVVLGNRLISAGEYLDPALAEIKATHEVMTELKNQLMESHGQMIYSAPFGPTYDFDHWFLNELEHDPLLINAARTGEWQLQESLGECNYWCWRKWQRVVGRMKLYQLIHQDGTRMVFELPKSKDRNLHCIVFKMPPAEQGNFFKMLRRFKFCFDILCVRRNTNALQSPCLGAPMKDYPIRDYGAKEDWRFTKQNLGGNNSDCYRLLHLWLKAGAMRPKLENDNPDNLFFFHPSKVLEVKELAEREFGENPCKHIGRSIYPAGLTKRLKADI
jgi:hypothetical protein